MSTGESFWKHATAKVGSCDLNAALDVWMIFRGRALLGAVAATAALSP